MARSIVGLFPDRTSAERAILDLKEQGFDPSRIGILMPDKEETREVVKEQGTRSGEGAVAGGIVGGTAGALLAATGALVIPGIGPIISGGILAALIGGTAGALVGGLAGLGIPEEEAKYYQDQVSQGRALVTVDATGRDEEARAILVRNGAENLQDQGMGLAGVAAPTQAGTRANADTSLTRGGEIRIPVREEELVADTRPVALGQVHVHKDVVQEQQTVRMPLDHEQVIVERVPFSGDATKTADSFTEQDIDVPLMGEEAVVDKRVHVVEEVRIHKEVVTENEQVSDTVRKERVTVEGADETGQVRNSPADARARSTAETAADDVRIAKDRLTMR